MKTRCCGVVVSTLLFPFALGSLACDMASEPEESLEFRGHDDDDDGIGNGNGNGKKAQLIAEVRAQIDARDIEPLAPAPAVSDDMFELGQALSFDKVLSGNSNISCLTCHHPSLGTDDDRALPRGEGGVGLGVDRVGGPIIPRNAPDLFNLHTYETMFWDSRVEVAGDGSLSTPAGAQITPEMEAVFEHGLVSAQAMFPVTSREEMRGHVGDNEVGDVPDGDFTGIWEALMTRLGAIPEYVCMFEDAYPGTDFDDMTFAHAANAIAAFEVSAFESRDSDWERFVGGDDSALSKKELQGAVLFFDSGCGGCHSGATFSDFSHHNTGLPQLGPGKGDGPSGTDDFGREQVTGDLADRYAFRTPPLFNVELTGPFGHDGQFAELRDHIRHYVDPEASLLGYDITQNVDEEELWPLFLDNTADVLAGLSPFTQADLGTKKINKKVRRIEAFLETLTGDGARDLTALVPPSVPSGLPVID